MKKQILLSLVLLTGLLSAQQNPNKAKLVEKVVKKGNEIVIPYERYLLPNGLNLIIHEDHSDPVVHVDMTYHVGSNREQPSRSGFAHFFEHMMFQGSDNVKDEEHFSIVTESGGTLNGTTNSDRTNYFETLPSNMLEIGLWLEADRMGFLLDAVTQKKFEIQRSTVKNERGQNYDNRPYGLIQEKVSAALYPKGHPYSWPTIGYIDDLNRVNVNDLKKFFMRWYGPNNAVLTVAGDVTPSQVVELVEKYYGSIPRCPEVKNLPKMPVKLDKTRYISYEDPLIRFPLIQMNWPTPHHFTNDEAALDVLANILGGDKNSILYQNLVKTQKALQATVNNPTQELCGRFIISIVPYPGHSLQEMDSLVRIAFKEFEKRGVNDEDLKKYKASYESSTINGLQSVSGKASQLASFFTFTGNANFIKKDMERYLNVKKEDVMRVYNQYIKDKPSVVLSVYSKGKPDKAAPDNFTSPVRDTLEGESPEYKNLVYKKAKDNFDRSKKPAPGPNPTVKVPDIWQEKMPNGLKMIGAQTGELPIVTIQFNIECGHRFEEKSKSGVANILASLLNESTMKHTAEQMSNELDLLGSSIEVSSGPNEITITVNSLSKNLDATLKLFEEIVFSPKFDTAEFSRVKKQVLENIANQSSQPTVLADNAYRKLLYGPDHIMSVPTIGTKETVGSITVQDVIDFYNNNWSPSICQFVVVGDVSKDMLLPKLERFTRWADKKIVRAPEPKPLNPGQTTVFLMDKSKSAQTEFRIGNLSLPYDATGEYYKAYIMNFTLGGGFSSRINLNIREDKGWSYNAYGNFRGGKYDGTYTVFSGIRRDASDSALVEFMKELKNFREGGIKPEELTFTKNSIGQSDALKYETSWQKAGFLKRILDYNLDKSFVDKQNEILKNITKEEIDAIAKKYLDPEKMVITVVGDKEKIYDGIKKVSDQMGYKIVEIDTDGNVIKKEEPKVEEKKTDTPGPFNYETKDKKNKKKKKN